MSDAWPMEGASTAAGSTQQASDAPTSTVSVVERAQGRMVSGSIRYWYGIGINELRYCTGTAPCSYFEVTGTARLYRVLGFLFTGERQGYRNSASVPGLLSVYRRASFLLFFFYFLFPITVHPRFFLQGFADSWQR